MKLHPIIDATRIDDILAGAEIADRLRIPASLGGRAVFTSSLGIEDQVITHLIARSGAPIDVVTLETGRLFQETLDLIAATEVRYGISIARYRPEQAEVDQYNKRYGRNGFYESVEARHACCGIRKVRPLARALLGAAVWVTGLRRGQSGSRSTIPFAEYDPVHNAIKVNPLADWSIEAVNALVVEESIPVNPLHSRGYPSIGCEPCTCAVKPGEDERAGRWWWESDDRRECGLHVPDAALPSLESSAL